MSAGHWGGVARYGLPGLVAGLVLAWWSGGHGPTALAQGATPTSESNGTIAFVAAASGSSSQMLYLIDTKSQALAVYRVDPTGSSSKGSGTLKLEAARQYKYDLKLSEFNNQPPEVSSIEAMVKSMAK